MGTQLDLKKAFADRIATRLQRKTITDAARFAENYRIMGGSTFPGKWTFKYHPWLRDMHTSDAVKNVGMKCAQVGYTECMLNIVFYKLDVEQTDVLYVLPNKIPDCTDFSASRFNPAIELSPHLRAMFDATDNMGHKRCGNNNLFIRGSQAKSGLRSIPVGLIILDEVSVMNQENITLALERTSGQLEKQIWMISTPTIEGENIDAEFKNSTQNHFCFKCKACGRYTELTFPECFVLAGDSVTDQRVNESYYQCKECKTRLPYDLKATKRQNADAKADWLSLNKWIPTYTDREVAGWHVNQMYSPTISPGEFGISFLKGKLNPTDQQEFFNSKVGITHCVEGARVTDKNINDAKRNHRNTDPPPTNALLTLGVDVGIHCYYEIDQWFFPKNWSMQHQELAMCKVIRQGFTEKDMDFSQLDDLMRRYNIQSCVIDSQPERRAAQAFANRHYGKVKLCVYARGIVGKTISTPKDDTDNVITVDRTSWLDLSLGRFRNGSILLPLDVSQEFKEQIKTPVRLYSRDKDGNPVGKYEGGDNDHSSHARNYAEIALPFALARGQSHNMKSPI